MGAEYESLTGGGILCREAFVRRWLSSQRGEKGEKLNSHS